MTGQPWIGGRAFDTVFILSPGFLVAASVLCFPGFFRAHEVTPLVWAVLIVGVDVAHVYSTLYRTYFDPREFRQRRTLYVVVPVLGWLAFVMLYSLGEMVFWHVLAYLAVFHFVRQQYGFMMIYRRREHLYRAIDTAAVYAATLYPLLWWHTHTRHFSWFVEGDFFSLPLPWLAGVALLAYAAILAAYVVKECLLWWQDHRLNIPRNLLLFGTALSWWTGIVRLDSDLAFTATNVLAHGAPYMALVWLFGRKQARDPKARSLFGYVRAERLFSVAFIPLFIAVPILFAWFEEGLWDGFIWTEHPALFRPFTVLSSINDRDVLTWLVPLLALPQITHYLLDAFIWRVSRDGADWKRILFQEPRNSGSRSPVMATETAVFTNRLTN